VNRTVENQNPSFLRFICFGNVWFAHIHNQGLTSIIFVLLW